MLKLVAKRYDAIYFVVLKRGEEPCPRIPVVLTKFTQVLIYTYSG